MTSATRIRAAVAGASGYTGAELTKLLAAHPRVDLVAFFSSSAAGDDVAAHLPAWRGHPPLRFLPLAAAEETDCDVVFFATPHEAAMELAPPLIAAGRTVIDLSAAFRLADESVFEKWYGAHAAAEVLPQAVYGLSETAREDIKSASLIACPGCYATAVELALIPLVAAGQLSGEVLVDAKSGVSGAGRSGNRADLLLAEMGDNFKAYALDGHRHLPEILQTLRQFSAAPASLPPLIFVPHLLPLIRGIHANIYAPVADADAAAKSLAAYWRDARFIEVLPPGMVAELSQVVHSNRVILSAHPLSDERLLVSVVLDNLQKGAAGQAVQNMNIRFGLDEADGLTGARPAGARSA